jgi:SAM-dependent methyltransferase
MGANKMLGVSKENFIDFIQLYMREGDKCLDVGSGDGELVSILLRRGKDAIGIDVEFKGNGDVTKQLISEGKLLKIDVASRENQTEGLIWPIRDGEIDFLFTRAVVEHVPSLKKFAVEQDRVLSARGVAIHYFPSKFSLIEPHIGVPLGAVFQSLWYYRVCDSMGLINPKWQGRPDEAFKYMKKFTFYSQSSKAKKILGCKGLKVKDITKKFLASHPSRLIRIASRTVLFVILFRILRSRVLLLTRESG